jgi:type IV pilus assembly protein PilF
MMRLLPAARASFAILAVTTLAGCVSQSAVQSHPVTDSVIADAHRRAEVHTALAGEYFSRGNYNVALSEARLAVKDDPNYMPAYNVQGLVYMELREDVAAREAFDRALSLSPNNAEVLNNFGWFLCTRNDTERGMEMLKRAVADPLYPTPEKAYLSTGLCLRRMHKDAEAEQYLRRAVAIRPDLIGGLYNLAVITYERGAYKEAEGYLNRYMRLLGAPPLDGLVLGVKIARGNKDSAAEESFLQQMRRRYPDAPQTRELAEKRP